MKSSHTGFSNKINIFLFLILALRIAVPDSAFSQSVTNRINFANKNIFLSGINMAWVNFAGDLGPNPANLNQFRTEFQTVRDTGGNVLRFWLNTDGSHTPVYDSLGFVSGPGPLAIQNLKEILALARQYDVGLILCLWSHDMLNQAGGLSTTQLNRNDSLLTDTSYTMAYIRNALIPMVDSLKGNPSIVAWEIFNEPEGITDEFGWSNHLHVPIADIQRCINLMAGAIHGADSTAQVTSGAVTFQTLTDVQTISTNEISGPKVITAMSSSQQQKMVDGFNALHRTNLTLEQFLAYLDKIASMPNMNYYRDDRLKAAGGDSLGTLNFYCVHYYSSNGTSYDPFIHQYSAYDLDKPVVTAEFHMDETNGVPSQYLYPVLYENGYAGAMVWSWTDFTSVGPLSASETWSALIYMRSHYRHDVDVFGADWPTITIVSPVNDSSFPDSTQFALTAAVVDTGSSIASVKFYLADSLIGEADTPSDTVSDTLHYSFEWKNIAPGSYALTAIATNIQGQQEISNQVQFSVGNPPMTRLSVKQAIVSGSGMSLKSGGGASGGYYLDIAGQSGTITWRFVNLIAAGNYPISFGYNLHYDTPKWQYIYVNGVAIDTLDFNGATGTWGEKTIVVPLVHDTNTVQMQLYWGWMYLDYLAVPTDVVTSVTSPGAIPITYSLSQNFPNPFNPSTTIGYQLPVVSHVTLKVYDVLGREVATLIDGVKRPGRYQAEFDGSRFASGVYFFRVNISGNNGKDFVSTKKMMLLK